MYSIQNNQTYLKTKFPDFSLIPVGWQSCCLQIIFFWKKQTRFEFSVVSKLCGRPLTSSFTKKNNTCRGVDIKHSSLIIQPILQGLWNNIVVDRTQPMHNHARVGGLGQNQYLHVNEFWDTIVDIQHIDGDRCYWGQCQRSSTVCCFHVEVELGWVLLAIQYLVEVNKKCMHVIVPCIHKKAEYW